MATATQPRKTMESRVETLAAQAREAHRRGDVTRRAQLEETIREIAPRAYAAKVIKSIG